MDNPSAVETAKLVPKRVLVVEDDEGVREALETILMDHHYIPLCTSNGAEAFAVLDREGLTPGLIILDLWMPEMDGVTFLGRLRADARFQDVPVIVVSADGQVHDISKSLGAVASLGKPFDIERFSDAVRRYFRAL